MPKTNGDYKQRVLNQKTVWAAGAYDALSALYIQKAGFDAVMTSGFGVSASFLGMPDAELYTMSENLAVVRNVANVVNIPLIADIDTGYGNAINAMRTVREFEAAGCSAVIMEDQVSPKRCPIFNAGSPWTTVFPAALSTASCWALVMSTCPDTHGLSCAR